MRAKGSWDVYGWRHNLTRKTEEITGLRRKLKYLNQEISEIKGLIRNTHRNAPRGKEDEGPDPEGREQNEVLDDQAT